MIRYTFRPVAPDGTVMNALVVVDAEDIVDAEEEAIKKHWGKRPPRYQGFILVGSEDIKPSLTSMTEEQFLKAIKTAVLENTRNGGLYVDVNGLLQALAKEGLIITLLPPNSTTTWESSH
jgi:hypothetical protein